METEPKVTDPIPADHFDKLPPKKSRAKPQRFSSRDQILKRIDKFTAKANRQRDLQKDCYLKAAQLRRHSPEEKDDDISDKMKTLNAQGDKWGRKADRLEKDVLPMLKRKLAEFDTETLPGVDIDRSIPGI